LAASSALNTGLASRVTLHSPTFAGLSYLVAGEQSMVKAVLPDQWCAGRRWYS
jgi:hypothetical protein